MSWKSFLQANFDKILLIFLVHALVTLMLTACINNASLTAWLQNEASTAMGALIMLITGRATKPDPTGNVTSSTVTTQSVTVPPVASPPPLENPADTTTTEAKPDLPVFGSGG